MRIAILHYSSPPILGHVEHYIAQQAEYLSQMGHQVRVLTGAGGQWAKHIEVVVLPLADINDPDVARVKAKLDQGRVPRLFHGLRETLKAQLQAALSGIDTLFVHNVCSVNKNLSLTAALHQLNGTPGFPRLVCWHHDHAWVNPNYAAELHAGAPWNLLRTAWPGLTHVAPSEAWRQDLAKLFKLPAAKIALFPHEAEFAAQRHLATQTMEVLNALALVQVAPVVVLPTHHLAYKSLKLALNIWAAMCATWPAAQLLVFALPKRTLDWQLQLEEWRAELGLNHNVHFLVEHNQTHLPKAVLTDLLQVSDAVLLTELRPGTDLPSLTAREMPLPVFCNNTLTQLPPWVRRAAIYFDPRTEPKQIASFIQEQLSAQPAYALSQHVRRTLSLNQLYHEYFAALLEQAKR